MPELPEINRPTIENYRYTYVSSYFLQLDV